MIIDYNFDAPRSITPIKAQRLALFFQRQTKKKFISHRVYTSLNEDGIKYYSNFKKNIIYFNLDCEALEDYHICSAIPLVAGYGFESYRLLGMLKRSLTNPDKYDYIDRRCDDPLIIKLFSDKEGGYERIETMQPVQFDHKTMANLSPENKEVLINFFNQQQDTKFFPAGDLYLSSREVNGLPESCYLMFMVNIVKYQTNKSRENRYGLYGDTPLAEGGVGRVYQLKGTLTLSANNQNIVYKDREFYKPLVTKVFTENSYNGKADITEIFRERDISAKNLKVKDVVLGNKMDPHLLLKYFPYSDLCGVIQADEPPSTDEKLCIFFSALVQLDKHVHSQGIAHLDIKPENMIYNPYKKKITYIDYGFSKRVEETGITLRGSLIYAPLEVYLGEELTPKSDMYSLGVALGFLFNCYETCNILSKDDIDPERWEPLRFYELIKENPDLPEKCALLLQALLINLTSNKMSKRISVVEAIEIGKVICSYYKQQESEEYQLLDPAITEFTRRHIDPLYSLKAKCQKLLNKLELSVDNSDQHKLDILRKTIVNVIGKLEVYYPLLTLATMPFSSINPTEAEVRFLRLKEQLTEAKDKLKKIDNRYEEGESCRTSLGCTA